MSHSTTDLIKMITEFTDKVSAITPTDDVFAEPMWFDPLFGGQLFGHLFTTKFANFNKLMLKKLDYTLGVNNPDMEYNNLLERFTVAFNQVHVDVRHATEDIIFYCNGIRDILDTLMLDDTKQTIGKVLNKILLRAEEYSNLVSLCAELSCDTCYGKVHKHILNSCEYVLIYRNNSHECVYHYIRDWVKEFKQACGINDHDDDVD